MEFNKSGNPAATALYLVDRGMQGKAYRWFDAQTETWGMCGTDMQEALDNKDKTAVGFFPWVGPLTGTNLNPGKPVKVVTDDAPAKVAKTKVAKVKPAKKMAKQRTVAVAAPKTKQTKTVNQFPDGTVWFRADRQKWIAQWGGKQEAARPTKEACLKFLKKKYNVDGVVVE